MNLLNTINHWAFRELMGWNERHGIIIFFDPFIYWLAFMWFITVVMALGVFQTIIDVWRLQENDNE